MKLRVIIGLFIVVLLAGCGGGGGSGNEHVYITTPNGFTFSVVDNNVSYQDFLHSGTTHLYAIQVSPGYQYSVYLDTTAGDSDLYLYYDYTLSGQSLLGYSDFSGHASDSVTFYSDFSGIIYIEVYGVVNSDYLISVDRV